MLHLFTDPIILEQIGFRRIDKFLNTFAGELAAGNPALLATLKSAESSATWPADLAASLTNAESLPERLRTALHALETAASPENSDRLNALIQRHIPNVSLNRGCPLDCALELWLTGHFSSSSSVAAPEPDKAGPRFLSHLLSKFKVQQFQVQRLNSPRP